MGMGRPFLQLKYLVAPSHNNLPSNLFSPIKITTTLKNSANKKTSRAPQRSSRSRKGRDIKVRNDKGFLHMILFRPSGPFVIGAPQNKVVQTCGANRLGRRLGPDTHTKLQQQIHFFCWDTWDSRTKIYLLVLFFFLFQWHHKNCFWTLQVYGMTRLMLGNQVRQKGSFDTNMPKSKICYSLKWTVGNY